MVKATDWCWKNSPIEQIRTFTQGIIKIRTVFDEDDILEAIFDKKSDYIPDYEVGKRILQAKAEKQITDRFSDVASTPVDRYGNAVMDLNKRKAYKNIHESVRKPFLLSGNMSISNIFIKFAVPCATCDKLRVKTMLEKFFIFGDYWAAITLVKAGCLFAGNIRSCWTIDRMFLCSWLQVWFINREMR